MVRGFLRPEAALLRIRVGLLLVLVSFFAGCGGDTPPAEPSPGGNTGDTISGTERIGWDQSAVSSAELATFRYRIYVDGTPSEMNGVLCEQVAGPAGFPCSGRLPSMTAGTHLLEIAAFVGDTEGPRSAALRVTVAGAVAGPAPAPLVDGEQIRTADGVELTASLLAEGLEDVTDMAIAQDGRLVIAERGGCLRVVGGEVGEDTRVCRPGAADGILSVTLSPDFTRTGHLFLMHTLPGTFRVARYRLFERQLLDRMLVLRDVPASALPSAVLRFGPDEKLYAAFDDGGSRDAAERQSEWNGKVLRVNPDGRTPDDQPAASPVFWSGLASPRGLDWRPDGGALWLAEAGPDGTERIRALVTGTERPRRAGQRASYVVGQEIGVSSLVYYRGDAVPQFRGDMFIALRDANYLLRVRFDERDAMRAITTEKLLEGRPDGVRAVVIGPDGALYVATNSAVWRLSAARASSGR
jgi:glucose/arabinose dehydrogenase